MSVAPREGSPLDLVAVQAWLRAQDAPVRVALACAEHPDSEALGMLAGEADIVARVPGCLANLPRAVPVELILAGAGAVHLILDRCVRREDALARFGDLGRLFAHPDRAMITLGRREEWTPVEATTETPAIPVLDAANMPVPRRSLLGLDGGSDGSGRPVTDHARLVTALSALQDDSPGLRVPDPAVAVGIPGPGLLLNARGCRACGVCVRHCPDALELTTHDGISVLRHTPRSCAGGGECIEVCPVDALSVRRQARWSEQLTAGDRPLITVDTAICTRCGTTMPNVGEDLCEVCAFRQAEPFGSHLPPAAAALLAERNREHPAPPGTP